MKNKKTKHRKHFQTSLSADINAMLVSASKHTAQTKHTHTWVKIKCFDADEL